MNKKINVYGMHCKACELLLTNKLSEIDGVKVKDISMKNNYVDLELKNEKLIDEIKKVIEDLGYHTEKNMSKKNTIEDYFNIIIISLVLLTIYFLFRDIKLFENLLQFEKINFLIILLIGLVASVSSCLAVTGGIVIGFSKYIDTSKSTISHFKTQLKFHIGRIFGFALGGGILGSIGGYLGTFGMLNKFLLLLAGIFMIYMGLNILKILPSIGKLGLSMPKSFGDKVLSIKNPVFAPLVGALTFFLPCGFTQSMQVYAASSASFWSGAIIMAIFAIGTMPVLFLVGFGSSYFKDKNFNFINKVIGVVVVYFGIFIISGFLNMFNLNLPATNINDSKNQNIGNLEDFKEVFVVHNGGGFEDDVILEGAKSYRLTINPNSDGLGCMYGLTIPGLDSKEYPVRKGLPIIIEIKNPKPGTYRAVCTAMGMTHGKIIIK